MIKLPLFKTAEQIELNSLGYVLAKYLFIFYRTTTKLQHELNSNIYSFFFLFIELIELKFTGYFYDNQLCNDYHL